MHKRGAVETPEGPRRTGRRRADSDPRRLIAVTGVVSNSLVEGAGLVRRFPKPRSAIDPDQYNLH
jgi:hypothetical protein